jgi:hypothetical protein
MLAVTRRLVGTCLYTFLLVVGLAASATAQDAVVEHPLAGTKLVIVDGSKAHARRISFTARFTPGGALDNPSFAGATLRVVGASATDGDTGVIQLQAAKWHALGQPPGSAGYRYEDPAGSAGGITMLMLRQRKHAGVLKITGGSTNWRYAIGGPQGPITITFTIGKARWCAEFQTGNLRKNVARRVIGKHSTAPVTCPCDRASSTFQAIQDQIFDRHGCTQAVCHGTSQGSTDNLDLTAAVAYQNLVGVPSVTVPGESRVEIGLPRSSVLWLKLAKATNGDDEVPGAGMPSGLPPLSASELEAVRLWIHSGAPQTGVVGGTESLLGSCLPPADPINIAAPNPPPPDQGVQLHAPPWKIPPKDPSIPGHDGEDEVCYATWYDFSATIPASATAPCPRICSTSHGSCQVDTDCPSGETCVKFFGNSSDECFYYNKSELTQDPDSHHSIIHFYKGAYDITDDVYTCRGGSNTNKSCSPSSTTDCPGGTCTGSSAFGPFSCLGGTNEGATCDPKGDAGQCPGGGCAGRVQSTIACILYGPPDFGFDVTGKGTNNAPSIGGSQQPVSSNIYPPQVFSMLPVKGTIVWDSHAFNLTTKLATNEQWLNLWFAGPSDRVYPVKGIFDSTDIFVMDVPPYEEHEYCRTFELPQGSRLFQFSSHTHKRGKLFRIWGPGITEECGTEPGRIPDGSCPPESTPPIFATTLYSDPEVLYFNPPVALDGADPASRRYKFCSRYDNGATNPDEVKRQSTSPYAPLFGGLQSVVGGPCPDTTVACLGGPKQGQLCNGNNSVCDSAPGLGDGVCDACPVHGGVTTEDEMFILLGLYYQVP